MTGLDEACTSWGYFINSVNNGLKVSKRPPSCFLQPCTLKGRPFVSLKSSLPVIESFKHVLDAAVSYIIQEHCFSFFPFSYILTFSIHSQFSITFHFDIILNACTEKL